MMMPRCFRLRLLSLILRRRYMMPITFSSPFSSFSPPIIFYAFRCRRRCRFDATAAEHAAFATTLALRRCRHAFDFHDYDTGFRRLMPMIRHAAAIIDAAIIFRADTLLA